MYNNNNNNNTNGTPQVCCVKTWQNIFPSRILRLVREVFGASFSCANTELNQAPERLSFDTFFFCRFTFFHRGKEGGKHSKTRGSRKKCYCHLLQNWHASIFMKMWKLIILLELSQSPGATKLLEKALKYGKLFSLPLWHETGMWVAEVFTVILLCLDSFTNSHTDTMTSNKKKKL